MTKYVYLLMKWSHEDGYTPWSAHVSEMAAVAQAEFNGWTLEHDWYVAEVEFYG